MAALGDDSGIQDYINGLRLSDEETVALERILGVAFPDSFDLELSFREPNHPGRLVRIVRRNGVTIRQWGTMIRELDGEAIADVSMPS